MKKVLNKEIELKVGKETDSKSTYADLLQLCINLRSSKWEFSIEEMRDIFRLSDVIEKGWEELDFEDNDFTNLLQLVEQTKYPIVNKEIIEFNDYILWLK